MMKTYDILLVFYTVCVVCVLGLLWWLQGEQGLLLCSS
jgi:hypothetical protein